MQIGIMGVGLMGRAFAERFMREGHEVALYNRHPHKIADLADQGFACFDDRAQFIAANHSIITLAADAEAIEALLGLHDEGTNLSGKTIVQMATISPAQSREISQQVQRLGGRYLEAPVLGSLPEAAAGSLIIMAGGDEDVYTDMLPLLQVVGRQPTLVGAVGSGAALKLSMNQLIAALTSGFALSLGYARENGVDTDTFMDTVRASALYAQTYDKKLDKYLSRDFGTANFSTRHLLKDVRLFQQHAASLGMATDALAGIERITAAAVEGDYASSDYSSIYQVIHPHKSER